MIITGGINGKASNVPDTGVIAATEHDTPVLGQKAAADGPGVARDERARLLAGVAVDEADFAVFRAESNQVAAVCVHHAMTVLSGNGECFHCARV